MHIHVPCAFPAAAAAAANARRALSWLCWPRVAGVGGASWVFMVLIMAALTDTCEGEHERARVFGVVMGLYYFCSSSGPILFGQLSSSVGAQPLAWPLVGQGRAGG